MKRSELPKALHPIAKFLVPVMTQDTPAVYFLCDREPTWHVVYVGKSECPSSRMFQHAHDGKSWFRGYALPCPADHMVTVEAAFIKLLKPRLNEQLAGWRSRLTSAQARVLRDLGFKGIPAKAAKGAGAFCGSELLKHLAEVAHG